MASIKYTWIKRRLEFKREAKTSRSTLFHNDVYYINAEKEGILGVGECNPLVGLSYDDRPDYELFLGSYIDKLNEGKELDLNDLHEYPSIKFGFESAIIDLKNGGKKILFPSSFTQGQTSIEINGLLWMGSKEFMIQELENRLKEGFKCIKMKVGAIDWDGELSILKSIRERFDKEELELRVDANGAFHPIDAQRKLEELSKFDIHSIEQPIKAGQFKEMARLVSNTPIDIALDEELIPLRNRSEREAMLKEIKPQYIILKPSLLGGLQDSLEWIQLAEEVGASWWITSALESNIGLNVIAQFTSTLGNGLPQGLGTGSLYLNNVDSPLFIENGHLHFDTNKKWGNHAS